MNKKGIITLSLLIFLTGFLAILLWFDDENLHLFLAQTMQRKTYVERSLALQKMSEQQKHTICYQLALDNNLKTQVMQIELGQNQTESLQHYVWCERQSLFKKAPTKGNNEGQFETFVNSQYFNQFKDKLSLPSMNLSASQGYLVYWFSENETEWQLTGTLNGMVVAEGNLHIFGKGNIKGAVITKGTLTFEPEIKITYSKKPVTELVQQYSQWEYAEKSWYDFKSE